MIAVAATDGAAAANSSGNCRTFAPDPLAGLGLEAFVADPVLDQHR